MTPDQIETELATSLPLPSQRWTPRRKATVIIALCDGAVTIDEVCRRYDILREELDRWISAFERYGVAGLRATRVQIYSDLRKGNV
jgi:transposase-like protein